MRDAFCVMRYAFESKRWAAGDRKRRQNIISRFRLGIRFGEQLVMGNRFRRSISRTVGKSLFCRTFCSPVSLVTSLHRGYSSVIPCGVFALLLNSGVLLDSIRATFFEGFEREEASLRFFSPLTGWSSDLLSSRWPHFARRNCVFFCPIPVTFSPDPGRIGRHGIVLRGFVRSLLLYIRSSLPGSIYWCLLPVPRSFFVPPLPDHC